MKLLLDQGLLLSAVVLLHDNDIDTIHIGEIGISETEDAVIVKRGRGEMRIVATLDADFHNIFKCRD
jgi:predicted nuclease of predicted toxin-antitoxin system